MVGEVEDRRNTLHDLDESTPAVAGLMVYVDSTQSTTNSSVYKNLHRYAMEKLFGKCSYCKPHRGENWRKYQRTWKKFRKRQTKIIRKGV